MADLSVLVTAENQRLRDFVYGASRSTGANTPLASGNLEGILHLADGPPLARLNPYPLLIPAEGLKLAASGQVDLYGLGAKVRVQDTVTALLVQGFDAGPEPLKVGEELFLSITPIFQTLTEVYHLTDVGPDSQAEFLNEDTVKLAEALSVAMDLVASPTEALKAADTASGQTTPILASAGPEALKVADSLTAGMDISAPTLTEALRVADLATPAQEEIATGGPEALHVTDSLSAVVDLLATPAGEALKVADSATGILDLVAPVLAEALKLADAVLGPTENPLQAAPADEPLHVQDQALTGNDLSVTINPTEVLRLADTATATLNPLFAAALSEALKLVESLTATEDPLVAAPTEAARLAETLSGSLDPLQAAPAPEAVHVADQQPPGASMGGLALQAADEACHVVDVAQASLDPLQAVPGEALRLQEAQAVAMVLVEVLHLADVASAALVTFDLSASPAAEALHLTEAPTGVLVGNALATEALRLHDTAVGTLDPLEVKPGDWPGESLAPTDTPPATLGDYIFAAASEALKGRDQAYTVPGRPDEDWVCAIPADSWVCTVPAEE
jgi:hypothetical protein